MEEKNVPIRPIRVRIIKCGRPNWWYADKIGQEFLGEHIWRHVAQADCIKIDSN